MHNQITIVKVIKNMKSNAQSELKTSIKFEAYAAIDRSIQASTVPQESIFIGLSILGPKFVYSMQ